jgi:hypothetical protein
MGCSLGRPWMVGPDWIMGIRQSALQQFLRGPHQVQ